jgi:hypothetical protein
MSVNDYRTIIQQIEDDYSLVDPKPPPDERSVVFVSMVRDFNVTRLQLNDWLRWLDEGLDFDAFQAHVSKRLGEGTPGRNTSASMAARFLHFIDEVAR